MTGADQGVCGGGAAQGGTLRTLRDQPNWGSEPPMLTEGRHSLWEYNAPYILFLEKGILQSLRTAYHFNKCLMHSSAKTPLSPIKFLSFTLLYWFIL